MKSNKVFVTQYIVFEKNLKVNVITH